MRLQSDREIRVPEMIPSHVDDRDFIIFRLAVHQNIKYKQHFIQPFLWLRL